MFNTDFENRIVDMLIVKEKQERAKYMLNSKKRYDFIWKITKEKIKEPYMELLNVSSWQDVSECLQLSKNEKCYVMSAFDKDIDGKILDNYDALSNIVFSGVGIVYYFNKNVLYYEGEPESYKSFRCIKSEAAFNQL